MSTRKPRKPKASVDLTRSSDVIPRKVAWLWKDRIPEGMIVVVGGKPDMGKGLFVAHVAADVSKRGGNVLYSAIEDAADLMTRPRLEAAGAKLDRILLWRCSLPAQLEELAQHVVDNDIRLVVLDPIAAHLGGGVSRHSDSIRKVTSPMSAIAEQTGCTFLVTDHQLKRVPKDAHPLTAIGGTGSGLPAASRMAFLFGMNPEDAEQAVLCSVKSNLREKPKPFAFEIDTDEFPIVGEIPALIPKGEIEFDVSALVNAKGDAAKVGRPPEKRAAAAEWLTKYLAAAGGPCPASQVLEDAKQHALSAKTIRNACGDMGVVKNPPGGGRNCTWDLPPEVKQALGVSSDA